MSRSSPTSSATNAADAASPLGIPEGKMAISVNLTDPDRVAGFVNPGSEVAIFVTTGDSGATPPPAERRRIRHQRCCWIGSPCSASAARRRSRRRPPPTDGTQQTEQLPRTLLTLALTQEEAQKVILASKTLDVTFALLTKDSTVRPTARPPPTPTCCPDLTHDRKVGHARHRRSRQRQPSAGSSAPCRRDASRVDSIDRLLPWLVPALRRVRRRARTQRPVRRGRHRLRGAARQPRR